MEDGAKEKNGKKSICTTSKKKAVTIRAKRYTQAETEVLIQLCETYYSIINKSAYNAKDNDARKKTWIVIKEEFDKFCSSKGIVNVSFHLCNELRM